MEIDRPHRTVSTPTTTSELFICFTSRLSKSSSMRHTSKSILSPSRTTTADKTTQPISLSTSLSRRLRHNGSLRGAQSPAMFPSKKTRGSSGFADNPEPSSPKVTCIGQVRVKTKKQGKKMKMKACRSKRLSGGEASFRCIEHPHEGLAQECGLNHRNQRWVHLPLTICEALRTFGNEFSCLFPCKSSCFSSCGGEKGGKIGEDGESSSNSCAVFRWLVSLQESESEGKRRDIELVVGNGEVEGEVRGESMMMERECSRRRSIFDDMEFDDLFNDVKNEGEICDNGGDNEEGARVSVCVPPKNALLLMRCRSNPMKMASLSHKLWDVPLPTKDDDVDVDDGDDDDNDHDNDDKGEECEVKDVKLEENIEVRGYESEENVEQSDKFDEMLDFYLQNLPNYIEDDVLNPQEQNPQEIRCEILEKTHVEKDENLENGSINESIIVENKGENGQNEQDLSINLETHVEKDENLEDRSTNESIMVENKGENGQNELDLSIILETHVVKDENLENGSTNESFIDENKVENGQNEQDLNINLEKNRQENSNNGCSNQSLLDHDHDSTLDREESSDLSSTTSSSSSNSSEEEEKQEKNPEENNKKTLPDCLLLMMCEPKLSIEVSKETWVCSTDFIRWLPDRQVKKVSSKKKQTPVDRSIQRFETASQPPVQPARSSISFPAGGNLVVKGGAGSGYEPLMLTRCKSAPMRSAAAKITPSEMKCSLWGKLEPHRPATFGF